ncbi:hypothetical protein P152DRAFT_478193 [Eremomyces bilateralis CBS 781.70]|uniref:Xylanolytic transcriptional activator regulatory domain-containing protein n=1 Tax=Eremomyces bilateralis CBS 781.70 TaxID=1392243 RepID=A0A6G1GGV4_9PEZI|nr:uncharacterized protein P152DRAFT_478193 [Eremomyces bilateralis CBS 781.70]KAF1817166.1 hypothetical protein P152DRAFT_478193 [Eremomyces bilateralis CBS 781.70]
MVTIYFAEFYPGLPVMHQATWNIAKCPTHLIAALACLGSTKYHRKKGLDAESSMLAEICFRHLNEAYARGPADYQNIEFAAASLYHQVYCLGVAVPSLHERADNFRGILVQALRRTGVYRSINIADPWSLKVPSIEDLDPKDAAKLEFAWHQWRAAEMAKRLAWSVFEYDNSLSTLTTKRGVVSLQELPDRLPCDESLWEAQSAVAWASMASLTGHSLQGAPFRPLLREILNGKAISDNVPSWWKRCCAQTIARLFWNLKEMDNSILNLYALNSFTESQKPLRKYLFQSLKLLHDSAVRPSRPQDLVHVNITCLIYHHANLYSQQEMMEMIILICQNGTSPNDMELDMAKTRLQMVLASDPVHARRLVYHAASIIAISRECTVNTPCEIMRVFDAYAYVLAFVKFGPEKRKTRSSIRESCAVNLSTPATASGTLANEASESEDSVRLDRIPWSRTVAQQNAVVLWINKNCGYPSIDDAHDIYEDGSYAKLKAIALQAIENLSVWDLSRRFYSTIESLN